MWVCCLDALSGQSAGAARRGVRLAPPKKTTGRENRRIVAIEAHTSAVNQTRKVPIGKPATRTPPLPPQQPQHNRHPPPKKGVGGLKNTYRCALSVSAKVDASAAIRSNFAAAFRLSAFVSACTWPITYLRSRWISLMLSFMCASYAFCHRSVHDAQSRRWIWLFFDFLLPPIGVVRGVGMWFRLL